MGIPQLATGEFVSLAHVKGDEGSDAASDKEDAEDNGSDGSDIEDVDTAEAKVKVTIHRRTRKVANPDKAQKELRKKPAASKGNKSKIQDRKLRAARTEARDAVRDW